MLWLLACTSDEPPETPVQATPPSVLVVVMDTVRADALSAYGNPLRTSPPPVSIKFPRLKKEINMYVSLFFICIHT